MLCMRGSILLGRVKRKGTLACVKFWAPAVQSGWRAKVLQENRSRDVPYGARSHASVWFSIYQPLRVWGFLFSAKHKWKNGLFFWEREPNSLLLKILGFFV